MGNGNIWITAGAFFAALGVLFGAMGAHALADSLTEKGVHLFQTAAHYQMIHALGLIVYGLWVKILIRNNATLQLPGWAFSLGTIFFSGSLYSLALTGLRELGWLTPIGGVLFIFGWLSFASEALRVHNRNSKPGF